MRSLMSVLQWRKSMLSQRVAWSGVLLGAALFMTPVNAATVTAGSFGCGNCNVTFSTAQSGSNTVIGGTNSGLTVTYTSNENIQTQGLGQSTIEAADGGLRTLAWSASQGYGLETFTVDIDNGTGGAPASAWIGIAVTSTLGTNTVYRQVSEAGGNSFTIDGAIGEIINGVVVTGFFADATGTPLTTTLQIIAFRQDRIDQIGGEPNVGPVPLPAGIVLLGSVLIGGTGLAAVRRRRKDRIA
jgi:hypothetical protein